MHDSRDDGDDEEGRSTAGAAGVKSLTRISLVEGSFTWNSIMSLSSERIRSKTGKTMGPMSVILVVGAITDRVVHAADDDDEEDDDDEGGEDLRCGR